MRWEVSVALMCSALLSVRLFAMCMFNALENQPRSTSMVLSQLVRRLLAGGRAASAFSTADSSRRLREGVGWGLGGKGRG